MTYTYKINSLLAVVSWQELIKAVFVNYDGQPAQFNGNNILFVTFATPQTPADLGPLVRVELISQ